ncbi:MAG TPA: DEAD/DEAH box helicase family protein [Bacteroidales bacterium]|nr:DEAD/DEAH box helicase family protein [Bacteroidales bacterium]
MEFLITSTDIKGNEGALNLFERFKVIARDSKGYCYYKYPIAGGFESHLPDIVLIDLTKGVCAFDILSHITLEQITKINNDEWEINGKTVEAPFLKLEDYKINLQAKYDKYRQLRNLIKINTYIIFPLIHKSDFIRKFGSFEEIKGMLFNDYLDHSYDKFWKSQSNIQDKILKGLFLSVSQGAGRLNNYKKIIEGSKAEKIGEAIKLIDTKIAYLDKQQHAAAIQIPDGPQRIRGMAGTGKTIILTMKAAFLHSRYPDKKILYTFHTQSLYNQIRDLITKFYRDTEEKDPDWNKLLILHSWGGKAKEGVYSRACLRNSIEFMPFNIAESFNPDDPLQYVCNEALKKEITEEYNYVLMDEAQDFPSGFYQLIYRLTQNPKRIIFAYDELQSLNAVSVSDTGELFGYNADGSKKVDFSKGTYDGNIEMDFVLNKSYRNPLEILMVAHSMGLGLYNSDGYMQVIDDKQVWNAIGYEVLKGEFKTIGEEIIIERPRQNSISLANESYNGKQPILFYKTFANRNEEISWIANQVVHDVNSEGVEPENIIVISLNHRRIERVFTPLQNLLFKRGIPSIIPGVGGVDRDKFGEKGFVTLSTVYKAKGNEAFIVYIMGFDYLYDYLDFVYARNRAFTSISRSKGWCRITGVGQDMERAISEIKTTQGLIPQFRFQFPDPNKVAKKLSQEEHARRLQEKKKGSRALNDLLTLEDAAINLSDEEKAALKKKLGL